MRDNDQIPSLGIGIKLISQIADELSYTRTSDHRNSLLIVKYFQRPGLVTPQNGTQLGWFKQAMIDVLNSFNWLTKQLTRQLDRSSNQPLKKNTLRVNTDIKAVTQVLWWVEELENLPIPEPVLQQCKLAIIEWFTNVVHHAHKTLPVETPIELEITVFNSHLEIEIWDLGEPFNFQAKLQEELQDKNPFRLKELGFML
jgi:serine/threonine-protein kinase RsbW